MVKEVCLAIVRNKEIEFAVIIYVKPRYAKAVITILVRDTCFFADLSEGPIAVVAKEKIALAFQAARPAHAPAR